MPDYHIAPLRGWSRVAPPSPCFIEFRNSLAFRDLGFQSRLLLCRPPHAQRIRYTVDVIEPRRDQRNLQNAFIVESSGPQSFVVLLRDLCGIPGEFDHIIQHHAFWLSYGSGRVVFLQRFD